MLALLDATSARPALHAPDDGTTVTHAQLAAAAAGMAGALAAAGVGRGDRVAVVLPNGPEIVAMLFATAALGAAIAPLNPAYTEPEYRFFLDDLDPRLLVVGAGSAPAARAAADAIRVAELEPWAAGNPPRLTAGGDVLPAAEVAAGEPGDVALLLHTSGTTSRPKQVPLLQRNLTAQAGAIARHYALADTDVSYCAMPLFHVHGLIASTLAQLAAGGTVIVPRRFSPRRFWGQARDCGVTWLSAGPTLHRMILDQPGEPAAPLRFVRSCSSALSPELMSEAEARYGVADDRGLRHDREQPPDDVQPAAAGAARAGVGGAGGRRRRAHRRCGGRRRARRRAGRGRHQRPRRDPRLPGQRGGQRRGVLRRLVSHRRRGRARGRLPAAARPAQGDDHPRRREHLAVRDRGGAAGPPAVAEAVVFGVDDRKYGETVAAAVVLRGAVGAEELREQARRSLAAFKVPDRIHILEEIPKTPTGKVQRSRMAARLEGEAE